METNVEKSSSKEISRQPSPLKIMIDQKIWKMWSISMVSLVKMMQDVTDKKVHNCHGKSSIQQVRGSF